MITSWDIYWITRLDGLSDLLAISLVLLIVAVVALGTIRLCIIPVYSPWEEKYQATWLRPMTILTVAAFVVALTGVLLPSTKDVAAIYLIPKLVNNEQVQKMPNNLAKLLNVKLEEWIEKSIDKKGEKKWTSGH